MAVSPHEPAELLGDLTPCQRQAVATTSATVCVMAAAGAGKTRVLTRRVGYRVLSGSANADHVLAITFTRKAAGELRERLSGLGLAGAIAAGTFHSLALHQLRRWWADRHTPEPAVLERKARLLSELAAGRAGLQDAGPADLAAQIEWAKARMVTPASFVTAAQEAQRSLPADGEAIAAIYARYEDEKRRRRLVDFDDLLVRYADALSTDARFAAAQRWRWRHVFVDELQDLNPLQSRLLLALLGDNDDLFVVGDPNQAIYGWNGADPELLSGFPRRWPNAEVVHLQDNHRSSPQVVAAATAVLGRQATTPVRSSRADGPLPSLRSYASEDHEAASVAAQVGQARSRGVPWGSMAVLARTNSQLEVVCEALARSGTPFRAIGQAEAEDASHQDAGALSSTPEGWVTVSSFHRAKGLQWAAVWVCGLEAGLVPIAYASNPAALAEERRLLYVALTRAERELHCSWARQRRSSTGAALWREPSPWLPALAAHCAETGEVSKGGSTTETAHPAAGTLEHLASARRRLSKSTVGSSWRTRPTTDQAVGALAEQLREWRRRLARASGVPPQVLLHDSIVQVIADRRPSTTEELLTVPGMGPVKVSRFGPAILDVVRESATALPALSSEVPVPAGA